jgi:hypothetical protein
LGKSNASWPVTTSSFSKRFDSVNARI